MTISARKNNGVLADFRISLSGVFIMKHAHVFGSLSMVLSSCCKLGKLICSTRSTALLPFLSLASLDAPLINRLLTGLVDRKASTDLTAKCNEVYPSMSWSFNLVAQASK